MGQPCIRYLAQCSDLDTGVVTEEMTLSDETVSKARNSKYPINERQKGKQKMLWGRDAAHSVLQIRTSILSKSWTDYWKKTEENLYKEAA